MRSERARFLDQRERRANDESSPVSSLGENGRGFDSSAPSLYVKLDDVPVLEDKITVDHLALKSQ
jgi:hypothetical protein